MRRYDARRRVCRYCSLPMVGLTRLRKMHPKCGREVQAIRVKAWPVKVAVVERELMDIQR